MHSSPTSPSISWESHRLVHLAAMILMISCIRTSGEFPHWLIADESSSSSTELTESVDTQTSTETTTQATSSHTMDSVTETTSGSEFCGNGMVDGGEECDDGNDNNNDACLNTCITARCGDGYVWEGDEECDDGNDSNLDACLNDCSKAHCGDGYLWPGNDEICDDGDDNGKYDKCNLTCDGYGEYCGDGKVKPGLEDCDSNVPEDGCLPTCKFARSCQEILNAYEIKGKPAPPSSTYHIHRMEATVPANNPFPVYCDMIGETGYTFLKIDFGQTLKSAPQAETYCGEYGLKLLVIRSLEHAQAAYSAATNATFKPINGGVIANDLKYLQILGIYPKYPKSMKPGEHCQGKPFKFDPLNPSDPNACPQWEANDKGPFWLSDIGMPPEPEVSLTCEQCSMHYFWTKGPTMIEYYTADIVTSYRVMCHVQMDG